MSEAALFTDALQALVAGRDLSEAQTRGVMSAAMSGTAPDVETAAILVALRMKGETAQEIAAAARVLREHMLCWQPASGDILDTCGTGGDGSGTFNISTATALVVAGAGVPVVKHGNRSVSSRTGSADVLVALGVRIDGDTRFAQRCLQAARFAFCFAPNFHPALKHVAALRRRLGVPTIFNCLGPLANPAGASRQLLGVGRPQLLDLLAGALANLGTRHALVVSGRDGLDEVSLSAATQVRRIQDNRITPLEWTPADFDLAECRLSDLTVPDAAGSASVIQRILAGEDGPAMRIVLANAAAGLLAAERVADLRSGVALAREAIGSGQALAVLRKLQALAVDPEGAVA